MRRFGIAAKIYLIVALMAVVAGGVGVIGLNVLSSFLSEAETMRDAARRALIGEKVNGLVLQVVMDSRGIYMAQSQEEVEKYAPPLLAGLDALSKRLEQWDPLILPGQRADFDALTQAAQKFITFRRETVRLARAEGGDDARVFGDNDANRSSRQALNVAIQQFAKMNADDIQKHTDGLSASYVQARSVSLTVLIGGVALGILLSWQIASRLIARPIIQTTQIMDRLRGHDLQVHVPNTDRGDEIGAMARAVEVFRDSMVRADELAAHEAEEQERRHQRAVQIEAMTQEFDQQVSQVVDALAVAAGSLNQTAKALTVSSERGQQEAVTVAAAAQQTSANVQTVASATEELSASIAEIAHRTNDASSIARTATEEGARANEKVTSLAENAARIGQVVAMITDIASQTNLLALNATIEAARAGEAGKGFAVVAGEVKNLANQTAHATEDIVAQIEAVQAATRDAVQAIGSIAATIGHINEISTTIASAVEEQGAATAEISSNVAQAATGVQSVTSVIDGVKGAAAETNNAASTVLTESEQLAERAGELKSIVDDFLSRVRTA